MDRPRRFYIPAYVRNWACLQQAGVPIQIETPPGCVGFALVFETEEQAQEFAPSGEVFEWVEEQG